MEIPQPILVEQEKKSPMNEKQKEFIFGLAKMIGFMRREGELYNDSHQQAWFTAQKDIFITVCECLLNYEDLQSVKSALEYGEADAMKKYGDSGSSLLAKVIHIKN